jgi:predicted ATPase/DNA-binding SARP family transcriptional activator
MFPASAFSCLEMRGTSMSELNLFLFGPPRFEKDGQRIEIGLRKSISLLVYLVITKQPHTREMLAGLFWPEEGQSIALGNLRRALYRITHTCNEELLIATRHTVELNNQVPIWTDVGQFQEHLAICSAVNNSIDDVDDPSIQRLQQAVDLYTGDFMSGFSLPDAPAFDEWQFFQSENLKKLLGSALEQLTNTTAAHGQLENAISYARRRLALDPLEERSHRRLIELYARSEQMGAALRQYEECRRLLNSELGLEPEGETEALYLAIRTRHLSTLEEIASIPPQKTVLDNPEGSISSVSPSSSLNLPGPPHNLPAHAYPFVGRQEELFELGKLLKDSPVHRLITIIGPGGIGKTRLALEAGSKAVRVFNDGVFQVPGAALTDQDEIVPAIAEQIGLYFHEGSPVRKQLLDYLSDKHMLLILDGIEPLERIADWIVELLRKTHKVKLLVTSHERLNLSAETVYVLDEMEYPENDESHNLGEYEAIKLLLQSARLVSPHKEFNEQDLKEAARICNMVQGMPLAIILSAGWLTTLSLEEIANEIEQSIDFLESQIRDMPERQRSIRATFEHSWKRLTEDDREIFTRLSIFVGGFTPQAAQNVAGASLRTLRTLIDKSLVFYRQDGRYEIHELLRQFGEEQLQEPGAACEIRKAHSQNYLQVLVLLTPDLKGCRQAAALAEIEAEFRNIRAAWEWALRHKDISAIGQAVEGLYLFCDLRGRQQEGAELFQAAQEQLKPAIGKEPGLVYGRILTYLSVLRTRYMRNNFDIEKTIDEGLQIIQGFKLKPALAFGVLARGHYYSDSKKDLPLALEDFTRSLELFKEIGDDYYTARALHLIGYCNAFISGLEDLNYYLKESLALTRAIGNQTEMAMLLISLSMSYFYLGDFKTSKKFGKEAAQVGAGIGPGQTWAQVNVFLGLLYLVEGKLEKARKFFETGTSLSMKVNFPYPRAYAQAVQCLLYSLEGIPDEGLPLIGKSKAAAVDPHASALFHWTASIANFAAGNYSEVRRDLQAIYSTHARFPIPGIVKLTLPVVSLILEHEGFPDRSLEVLSLVYTCTDFYGWTKDWHLLQDLEHRLIERFGPIKEQPAWMRGKSLSLEDVLEYMLIPSPVQEL